MVVLYQSLVWCDSYDLHRHLNWPALYKRDVQLCGRENKYNFSFNNEEIVLKPVSAEKTEEISTATKVSTEKEEKVPKSIAEKLNQQEQEQKHKQRAEVPKQQDESPWEPVYDENRNLDLLGKEKGAKN